MNLDLAGAGPSGAHYPVMREPPYTHAITVWDSIRRILTYEYNGRPTITITIPGTGEVDYRLSSDGDYVSHPFTQQNYVIVSENVTAKVRFRLTDDALCMRPDRAGNEQAILAQVGRPLMYGVSGLYDINQDLLIFWNGSGWKWEGTELTAGENGDLFAEMTVELGPSPWLISLKMHYYGKHLGYEYHKPWEWRPKVVPVAGWCSWEAYRRNVTEENIKAAAKFVHENFQAYGMKYIQLDDGFQPPQIPSSLDKSIADDWLAANEKFPSGHPGNVEAITRYGLEAGIWIYTYSHSEEYARVNPGFIKDGEGNPLKGDWIGYVVDCTPETLKRYVIPSFEGFKEYGYAYVKTDGLRHLLFDGLHEAVRRGLLTNMEAEALFRRYVEAIRAALGKDIFYLSSWGIMTQMVGVADACRIACDVDPSWSHMRMQMVETARWIYTQRILFINDPDHLCLRSRYEWARSAISLASLSGGLLMLSDAPDEYDEKRVDMIQKNLPALKTYAGETGILPMDIQAFTWTKAHGAAFTKARADGPYDEAIPLEALIAASGRFPTLQNKHPFSTLWAFHINTPLRNWCIAGRFATSILEEGEIAVEDLSLDPGNEYLVFDFWQQQYLGAFREKIPVRALDLGHCQILSLCVRKDIPQFMASSRHVSMDAVSLKSQTWDAGRLALRLEGVEGASEDYFVHVPSGYTPKECTSSDVKIERFVFKDDVLKIGVGFDKAEGTLEILFDG